MYKETLGSKLKTARLKAGYTQEQITIETGLTQSQLSKIENNKLEPNIKTLGILIDFYEVSADWVLGTGITRR